jgi:hypothetical protein
LVVIVKALGLDEDRADLSVIAVVFVLVFVVFALTVIRSNGHMTVT